MNNRRQGSNLFTMGGGVFLYPGQKVHHLLLQSKYASNRKNYDIWKKKCVIDGIFQEPQNFELIFLSFFFISNYHFQGFEITLKKLFLLIFMLKFEIL